MSKPLSTSNTHAHIYEMTRNSWPMVYIDVEVYGHTNVMVRNNQLTFIVIWRNNLFHSIYFFPKLDILLQKKVHKQKETRFIWRFLLLFWWMMICVSPTQKFPYNNFPFFVCVCSDNKFLLILTFRDFLLLHKGPEILLLQIFFSIFIFHDHSLILKPLNYLIINVKLFCYALQFITEHVHQIVLKSFDILKCCFYYFVDFFFIKFIAYYGIVC